MGFFDKIKRPGQRQGNPPNAGELADQLSYSGADTLDDDPMDLPTEIGGNPYNDRYDDRAIISESTPSGRASPFAAAQARHNASRPASETRRSVQPTAGAELPLIGHLSSERQQRLLVALLGMGVVGLVLASVLAVRSAGGGAAQVGAVGQALMQSQRLAKAALQAIVGHAPAFAEVREADDVLVRNVHALRDGGGDFAAASGAVQELLDPLLPLVDKADKNARTILGQEKVLTQVGQALRTINTQSADMLTQAEAVSQLKLQQNASAPELTTAGQLVMLTQRIGKSANESLTVQGVSPESVFLLGKDINTFRDLAAGLLDGNADLRLPPTRDAATRERLAALIKAFEAMRTQGAAILGNLQGLVSAREAQAALIADSEPLRVGLEKVEQRLSGSGGMGWFNLALFGLSLLLGVVGGFGLLLVFTHDQRQRAFVAEEQRIEAERQEREAKRVNDANQAAILRLMNELQSVAEGDLTQQATVTEDITGAIADSVNYTVEELRSLVAQVQGTASRVTDTTQQVETTSTELLAASDEQLREIRETGEAVLQMAGHIQRISGQATQSAEVARQSLSAATSGLSAVTDTIAGMNTIREQIQETSKRIKRLGESSQEIGEITELISDITEQTNVLALNAAIQAASAGEAGRGFSVVAEEVQRLAERSADATRQIAVLVRTIQTDTADAVAAMERSTQGVVIGAQLTDNAGTTLAEIDRVSRRLAELIEGISAQSKREAESANVVAENIQHIFAVTEQTGEGTRSTAQLVRQLSRTAEELRQSVARFKIS
jgi:twitching motility protein PilJ